MKKISLMLVFLLILFSGYSQSEKDSIDTNLNNQISGVQQILYGKLNTGVTMGGYGEITYNQPEGLNGELDVQRLVLLFGYKFNDRTQFITEIEFEHVEEVFVEQAFLNYSLNDNINLRGGLMLVPMGIINEYHEPTTFNGVNVLVLTDQLYLLPGEKLVLVFPESSMMLHYDTRPICLMVLHQLTAQKY